MQPRKSAAAILACTIVLSGLAGQQFAAAKTKVNVRTVGPTTAATTVRPESEIRERMAELRQAVTNADAKAMAQLWTLDGRYLDDFGNLSAGRQNLHNTFAQVFAEIGKPNVELVIERIRLLANNVAVVDGTVNKPSGTSGLASVVPINRFSLTFVRDAGSWLISSGVESPIIAPADSKPLNKLGWLIGEWQAERDGASVRMKVEWVSNNNFILCKYDVKKQGRDQEVETQVIGWDPLMNKPVSWHFGANGGSGQGAWQDRKGDWLVDNAALERDGSRLTSVNVISSVTPNSFVWQSRNRRLNGTLLEDSLPLKVDRVAK